MPLPVSLDKNQLEERWVLFLLPALAQTGSSGCIAVLKAEKDSIARNQLFRFAIRKMGGGTGASTADLDKMINVGIAAIDNALASPLNAPTLSALWIDEANISAYNLSANLCDCWGDGDSRTNEHFEAGLKFAEKAIKFRTELGKSPGAMSMAHWVMGKHLLSLQRFLEAVKAFEASFAFEQEVAKAAKLPFEPDFKSPGSLLLSYGFMGLAKSRAELPEGTTTLNTAVAFLNAQCSGPCVDISNDAKGYLTQLSESILRN